MACEILSAFVRSSSVNEAACHPFKAGRCSEKGPVRWALLNHCSSSWALRASQKVRKVLCGTRFVQSSRVACLLMSSERIVGAVGT